MAPSRDLERVVVEALRSATRAIENRDYADASAKLTAVIDEVSAASGSDSALLVDPLLLLARARPVRAVPVVLEANVALTCLERAKALLEQNDGNEPRLRAVWYAIGMAKRELQDYCGAALAAEESLRGLDPFLNESYNVSRIMAVIGAGQYSRARELALGLLEHAQSSGSVDTIHLVLVYHALMGLRSFSELHAVLGAYAVADPTVALLLDEARRVESVTKTGNPGL